MACMNLLQYYKKHGLLDRLIVISPTFKSNKEMFKDLPISDDDIYNPNTPNEVIKKVEKEAEDYEQYWEDIELWKKMTNRMGTGAEMDDFLLLHFYDPQLNDFMKPTHWLNGRKPIIHILVDDCQSSPLFKNRKFQNLIVCHRHVWGFKNEPGALGCSVHTCIQNYRTQDGGLPKSVRGNCTLLCVFKTHSDKTLEEIMEETTAEIPKEEFLEKYKKATDEAHSFLFIDYQPQEKKL